MPKIHPNLAVSTFSRRSLGASALAASIVSGCAPIQRSTAPLVLFICQYGTAKSAIARELFRARAKQRQLAVAAFSRGLVIEDHVTPQLRQRLAADGIDPFADKPQVLQPADWQRATVIVAFNPLPPQVPAAKVRDWTDLPSINDDYDRTRAELDRRLEALLDELAVLA